jgi:hypothetical protein
MATMAGGLRRLGTVVSTVSHNSNTGRASACRIGITSSCQYLSRKFVTKSHVGGISPHDPWGHITTVNRPRFFSRTSSTDNIGTLDVGEDNIKGDNGSAPTATPTANHVRLSKLLSQHTQSLAISRREAERLIKMGDVTVAGQTITSPHYLVNWDDVLHNIQTPGTVKVHGKAVRLIPPQNKEDINNNNTHRDDRRIWIVHKLRGEVVTEFDPQGRPSLMERLTRSGIGKLGKHQCAHVKAIGRLDMMTEGRSVGVLAFMLILTEKLFVHCNW